MVEVSASVLHVDNEKAIKTLYELETAKIDYFHIDVMDGKFVKNNTTEKMLEYSEYINSISNLPLDVHLMVEDVEQYIKSFSIFEPNIITFHLEAGKNRENILKLIKLVKENNARVGMSLKPATPIEEIYQFLPYQQANEPNHRYMSACQFGHLPRAKCQTFYLHLAWS